MVNVNQGKQSIFPTITKNCAVSARELHAFLQVKTHFKDWVKRMFEYGFTEGVDYQLLVAQKRATNNPKNPFINETDYALSLDTAKEISMIQRSEKGKQARQYFIEAEKELRGFRQKERLAEMPLNAFDLWKHLELRMDYYDFMGRIIVYGVHGEDYTLMAAGHTHSSDALLAPHFAQDLVEIGFPKKRLVEPPKQRQIRQQKTVSIQIQY
jgi:phage anti-repressor protein